MSETDIDILPPAKKLSASSNEDKKWFVMRDLKRSNAKQPAYKMLEDRNVRVFTPMVWKLFIEKGKRVRKKVPYMQDLIFVYESRPVLDSIVQETSTFQYRYLRGSYMTPMTVRNAEMEWFIKATEELENPCYFTPEELTPELVKEVDLLEPCGMGNPKPRFKIPFKALPFNRIKGLPHIKARISDKAEIVAFNEIDKIRLLRANMPKEIFFTLEIDNFRGKDSVRALYKGFRITLVNPSDEMAFAAYAEKFLPFPVPKRLPGVDSGYDEAFGKVLLCFSKETFKKLVSEHPAYRQIIFEPDIPNPYNSVLMSPSPDADLSYYSVIELYDSPPKGYVEYLKNRFSAEVIEINNNGKFSKGKIELDRNALVKLFSYIKAVFDGKPVESTEDIYFKICMKGYDTDFYSFVTAWYVLNEIGVVYVDSEGKIAFSKEKKDLGSSGILKIAERKN